VIGEIIDDENDGEVVEEWTWQAYLDEDWINQKQDSLMSAQVDKVS
jgi:hypothetical protein